MAWSPCATGQHDSGPLPASRRVPATVGDELAGELAPLFLALDSIEEESECIRTAAEESVERRLAAAREEAADETAEAHRRAEAGRAQALAERREAREDRGTARCARPRRPRRGRSASVAWPESPTSSPRWSPA